MSLFDRLLPPSPRKFAALVADRLRQAGETRPIHYEKARNRLVIDGKPLPLASIFQEYRAAPPERREAVVRRAVQSWPIAAPAPSPAPSSPERLIPIVWPRVVVELAALRNAEDTLTSPWPYSLLGEHLAAGAAVASAGGERPVAYADLSAWNADFAEIEATARENLRRQTVDSPRREASGSLYLCEGGHAVARLLLDEQIASLALPGGAIAAAPQRELLLLAGADDAAGLSALAERAREAFDRPNALSGYAFQRMEGRWRPWLPQRGHPAYGPLKLLQIQSQARDYFEQKRALEELAQKAREPLCLASLSALEDERTGEPMSYTVWPEGLEILLPKADQVVFFQPDETGDAGRVAARGSWDRVLSVTGDLLEPLDLYPPRFLVRDFPSEQRLREIQEA